MNSPFPVRISVKVIDGIIILTRLRDIRRRGKTCHAVRFEEANRIQLVLANVLCLIAVLALRPDDGDIL